MRASISPIDACTRRCSRALRHASRRGERRAAAADDPRAWASSAAASSTIPRTSISFCCIRKRARPTAAAASTTPSSSCVSAQKIVQLLAAPTVDGFVYRVDLRLRPFGDSGRVAMGFNAFENYLQQHGRDWERYAYVKARALTATEHYPCAVRERVAAVRLSPLSGLRRVRVAARHEGDDRARGGAARAARTTSSSVRAASARSSSSSRPSS